ncbi:MAG: hypothetical protein SF053_11270 [Bacteroidia bacterium]|nr:hypothetical protein [Bacteroidia bacterium]
MKYIAAYFLLSLSLLSACLPPSQDEVRHLPAPDTALAATLGIREQGEIVYQWYETYGFTDVVQHLILVLKPASAPDLSNTLPISPQVLERFSMLNSQKYQNAAVLDGSAEKHLQADIRLSAREYGTDTTLVLSLRKGRYAFTRSDSTETLRLYDPASGWLFVEVCKGDY